MLPEFLVKDTSACRVFFFPLHLSASVKLQDEMRVIFTEVSSFIMAYIAMEAAGSI